MADGELSQLDERLREVAESLFARQCSDCKAIVLTGSKGEDAEERRTLIVVERWKAITAIITAALASPVIIAVLAALLK